MKPAKHGRDHLPASEDPIPAVYEIKVFADDDTVTAGDGAFIFCIPRDVGGTFLREADGFVTTVGSTFTRVQLRNITQANNDMLATRIRIDASEFTSFTSSEPTVVDYEDPARNYVFTGDLVAIDVDAAGTGAMGLGVMLTFGPQLQGPP